MANGGQVRFGIGFNVDKTSLNQLRTELQQIANLTNKSVSLKGMANIKSDLVSVRQTALAVDQALEAAFNQQLGTVNVSKFNAELKKSGLTMKTVHTDLSKIGTKGQQAFRNLSTQVLTTNRQLKQTHNTLDKMATTMGNTLKWGATSSIMNGFTGGVRKAYSYVKKLDSSLNDIRIVTEKSAAEMDRFAEKASKAAKSLAASTTDYTDAALIYYQQGLKDKEVEARANTTLKAANVTGQTGQEVSEQLTAVWNGYKVSAEETELYVDKLAAVAATTASDLQELSTGMEKVASAANSMGVDIDQLNGHLSTVISVTRQAPESVGTAFKTIYARLGDLAVGGEDEFGVKLGDVSSKLQKMGIEILDQNGNMREMGTVMEEVAAKWDDWTSSQRQAAAVAMAGKRQYNNLIALFDNWDMYTEAVETSANAMGTLQNQQDIYMESADAHVKIMKTSFEDLYDSLLNEDAIITVTDEITKVVEKMTSFVDAIGGGGNTLLAFGSIATRVFSKNIAQGLAVTIANLQAAKYNASQVKAEFEVLQQFKGIPISGALKEIVGWKQQILNLGKTVTNEQNNEANAIMKQRNELELLQQEWIESKTAAEQYLNRVKDGRVKIDTNNISKDPDNDVGYTNYEKATNAIKNHLSALEKQETSLKAAEGAFKNYKAAIVETAKSGDSQEKAQARMEARMKRVIKDMSELAKNTKIGGKAQQELNDALSKYKTSSKTFEDNEKLVARLKQILKEAGIEGKNALDTLEKEASGFSSNFKQQIEDCQRKWREFTQNLKTVHFIKSFITMTSAVGNLASAYQSLSNISKIANDESLSASERTTQIIMAVSMGISMLSMGISGLSQGLVGMGSVLGFSSVALDAYGKELTEEGLKAAIASKSNVTYQKSLLGVTVTAKSAAGAILKLIATFAPYIAILALLGGALYVAIKNFEKEAKAAEKAQKTAEELTKSHQRLQNEIGKVNEAIQTLKDNEDALKGLEKGTEAWNQKLKESNEYVLDLLDKYPQLGNHVFTDENGLLKISDKGLNDLKELKTEEEENSRIASSSGSIEANEKQIIANETKVKKELYYFGEKESSTNSYQKANRYEKGSNSTNHVKTNTGFEKIEISDDAFDRVLAVVEEKGSNTTQEDILEAVGGNETLTEKIVKELPDIIDLLSKNNALLAGNKVHEDQIVDKIIDKADLSSKDKKTKGLKGAAGDAYDQAYGSELSKVEKLNRGDLIDEYLESNSGLSISKEGSGRDAATFLDSEGNEVPVSLAAMQSHVASTRAQKVVEGKLDTIIGQLRKINSIDFAKGFSGNLGEAVLSGDKEKGFNLDSLSQGDISKLQNKNLSATDLGITDEYAAEKGFETADLYVEAFMKAVKERAESFDSPIDTDWETSLGFKDKNSLDQTRLKNMDINSKDWEGSTKDWKDDEDNEEDKEMVHSAWTYDDKETEGILAQGGYTEKQFHDKASEYYKGIADEKKITKEDGSLYDIKEIKNVEKALTSLKEKGFDKLSKSEKKLLKENKDLVDMMKEQGNEVEDVTTDFFKMNTGYQSTLDNYEKWSEGLKKGKKGTAEYANTLDDMRKAMANILGVSPDLIKDSSLTEKNLKSMKKAAEGDTSALWDLRKAVSQKFVAKITTDSSKIPEAKAQVEELFSLVQNTKPGMDIDTSQFISKITQLRQTTGANITDIMNLISQMGIQPKISWKPVTFEWASLLNKDKVRKVTLPFKVPEVTFSGKAKDGTSIAEPPSSTDSVGTQDTPVDSGDTSGGGGSTKEHEDLDDVESQVDAYREVNNELEKSETLLNRLEDAQDRVYGKDLLENLKAQSKELKNQIKWLKEKIKLSKEEAKDLKGKLEKEGFTFEDDGNIKNYESRLTALEQSLQAKINEYNAMSAEEQDSEEGKELKAEIEEDQDHLDDVTEMIENYDELIYSKIPGLEDSIREAAYQQIEIEIQAFKVEGQLYLDMSAALEQLRDFQQTMNEYLTYDQLGSGLDDDTLTYGGGELLSQAIISRKNAESNLDLLLGEKNKDGTRTGLGLMGTIGDGSDSPIKALTDETNGLLSEYQKWREDPEKYYEEGGRFAKQGEDGEWYFDEEGFRAAIEESSGNLEEEIQKVEDAYQQNREALLESIDLIGESFAQQMETYDFINDRIESQIEAAKLLGKPEGGWKDTSADNPNRQANMGANAGYNQYEGLQKYYSDASANAQAKADKAETAMAFYYGKMTDPNLTAEEREKWKKLYEEAVGEYEDASFAAIEAYKAENENFVRAQADELFGTDAELSLADAQWEIQTALDDKYLDSIDKAYETQKLSRKLQQDMEGASLAAQERLAKFRDEELEKLREKDKLTQYDVDRANKLYEIELKKIALEEAQQNKSQMRLRRDASGNYSYQFVADEDKTAGLEQELEDAQYGLREMDLEHQRELQEDMLQMQKDYKEKWIEYNLLSEEEKKMREAEYMAYFEYYQSELTNMSAQALETQDNLKESSFEVAKTLYSEDETNFQDLTDAQKLALQDKNREFNDLTNQEKLAITGEGGLMPTWNSAITTMANKFAGTGEDSFKSKVTKAQGLVDGKQKTLNQKIDAAAEGIQTAAETAQTQAEDVWIPAQEDVTDALIDTNDELSDMNRYLEDQLDWWTDIKDEALAAVTAANQYLALTAKDEAEDVDEETSGDPPSNDPDDDTPSGGGGDGKLKAGDQVIINSSYAESAGESYIDNPKYGKGSKLYAQKVPGYDLLLTRGKTKWLHVGTSATYSSSSAVGWIKKKDISGYDTGGYTGSGWATQDKTQGRLAFLHEKELVLNANDTANLLEVIRIIRDLFGRGNTFASQSQQTSDLEKEIKNAQAAYQQAWAEYNNASAADRDAKAQEYRALRDQLMELTQAEEEAKVARQVEYENATAQLEENRVGVRTSIEMARYLQEIAAQNHGRITAEDMAVSFEKAMANQNRAVASAESARQDKLIDSLNMTIGKIMQSMSRDLERNAGMTAQMVDAIRSEQAKQSDKPFEQNVIINAEFPNASKVEDIEKALNNLVNRASQKANSTGRKR